MSFNLAVILRESAAASPDKPVVVYDGGRMTYAQIDALSDQLAAGLQEQGLRPGDAVGLQLPNLPQFLVAYFGILKAGAVVVPMNVLLKAPEVAFYLGDSNARAFITWAGVLGDAAKGAAEAGVSDIFVVGDAPDTQATMPFARLLVTPAAGERPWSLASRPTPPSSSTPRGRRDDPKARS
jgi:long-chain acyl-CoA synthetase